MDITKLRTNHVTEPLGMELGEHPILSWVAESKESLRQAAAQVAVFDPAGNTVYDSGRQEGLSSLGTEAAFNPLPRTRYSWSVTVWGDRGDSATASSWFETAKLTEPWQAKWIAADFADKEIHPLLRKRFTLEEKPASARMYVCGLGIYELYINGAKAGDEYLLPGFHCYGSALEYQTFDVTGLLAPGENAVILSLGPGWYKGDIVFDRYHDLYGDTMQAILEGHILLEDGTEQVLCTDESWESAPSPIVFSNIYDGEVIDARKAQSLDFSHGVTLREEKTPLTPRVGPKIVKKAKLPPVEVIHTARGETVLDFGQNLTGWVEFSCHEKAGTEVSLTYGEVLQDGCFYRDNLRTAKAEFHYTSDGEARRVRPHFTFYGFRYVKVEGVSDLRPEDFTACHIRSDVDPIGSIETSDPRVNRLFLNAMWGQCDNFLDLPTDCPQRDERLGWTGDAAIISSTACKNLYLPAFFHHFVVNMGHEEEFYHGAVPFFVPAPHVNEDDKDFSWVKNNKAGCAIWSDAATMIPWAVYENYGDLPLLRREYPVMKTWLERIREDDRLDGDRGLWLRGEQLGDWLALDREDGDTQNPFGATSLPYTATAFYYHTCDLVQKAAKALGLVEDAAAYGALREKIKRAFLAEYFTEDGELKVHPTQTACVLSLFFGLYPEGQKGKVLGLLQKLLRDNKMHLNTGFCGTPFLCRALSDSGANGDAYTLFLNDDYPSWLFEVKMGATTVWERWNSILPDGKISGTGMNSLNHYAYGSIMDWVYRNVCGLSPVEEAPGYKRALIRPMPDPRLSQVKMSLDSASGRYKIGWRYEGERVRYEIAVPFDCEAELRLPNGETHTLTAGVWKF